MFKKLIRKTVKYLAILTVSGLLVVLLARLVTNLYSRSKISDVEAANPHRVAIVFGAGLWRDGSPTPVLRDRVQTAAELYFQGKVEKLLMSGDNSYIEYNEPQAMKNYAISLGVPEAAIVLDYAGRRTYDTCYRAKHIFGLDQALLVTQAFHLPRAVYLCNSLGVQAQGVTADRRSYHQRSQTYWDMRESLATVVALWEVHVSRPLPILGNPEPIFETRAGQRSY
ncbi:MAG: YdcF family protein [Anaerolineales bacterium]|nr:YdcF family protein [Anaerolineales bacterium]